MVIIFKGDIFDDYVGLRYIKSGLLFFGFLLQRWVCIYELSNRFVWCSVMEVLFKTGSKKYGNRIIL